MNSFPGKQPSQNFRVALFWYPEEKGGIVRCVLCPWNCRIREGRFGYCGVRYNHEGTLFTAIYGAVSSKAVDPIEKKPLFHFFPGTLVYSLGTIGCNLRCKHCQNWEIAHAKAYGYFHYLEHYSPEIAVKEAIETGSSGIALTYNEPTIWIEYAIDVFRLAKEKGLYTVFVTNGFINEEPLRELASYLDAYRVDVKGITEKSYTQIANLKKFRAILKAAEMAYHELKMHVEVVTNVIPGVNDSEEELRKIAIWIRDNLSRKVPWHVTRFYPYLGFSHLYPTPLNTLERAYQIGKEEGLEFVYLGNVPGHAYENTNCPKCGKTVIKRRGFYIEEKSTVDGHCVYCDYDLNIVE